ncbi:hypothetical protein QBC47DRAFT_173876 [Echria macrotheca]|uniref:Serum paraoxonase/arylesterase family protein n=1 Tax=Echria macrotheca TaxID=438768 RepID=A0AAJ0BJD4_9PEZI|nr:hypothetical protein QBC47DRAFT_173876 [Echria macrotheca]
MAGAPSFTVFLVGALLSYAFYTFGPAAHRSLTVLGVLRWSPSSTFGLEEVVVIPDTVNCEDLHYHKQSGMLFTACEDNVEGRFRWFPPLANFDDPELGRKSRGSIHVVNPNTMRSERLEFEDFDGPFITHGIDVIPDPERENDAVYIFAVNHVADPVLPKARSQIEVFHHVVGSPSVKHIRSVWHPLIRTPNDIFANSPTSIYVTNDHWYRDHGIMRALEDLYYHANWTDTVHLRFELEASSPETAVEGSVALDNMHNNNGLGHGRSQNEILVVSCTGGTTHIGEIGRDGNITLVDAILAESIVDNPTYFDDPFARTSGVDHSGILQPGLSRAIDLAGNTRNPNAADGTMVWFSKPTRSGWESRLLFEDDGRRIRTASASVLVAIEPTSGQAHRRQAWLFVTGFQSKNMIAVKVDL